MAASVFVSDEHALDTSIGVAELRLANLVQGGWLAAASHVAYQGGIDQLVWVGPFGDMPGASRLVRVQFVDPVYRDGAMTVGVRWEAAGATGGLFPVLDANIRLSGDGGQGSRVMLTACYRRPLGALGTGLDRLVLHKVATATIKTFLARVAGVLGVPARRPGRQPSHRGGSRDPNQPLTEARSPPLTPGTLKDELAGRLGR